ncbi:MAG: NRDE family protein, partial [Bacteroidetes bacterium]|nr:NRDE family protein [Bacteroidota bacterium]
LSTDEVSIDEIFNLLSDDKQFDDELLPDTGVGLEYERVLSSIFIKSPIYGTRSSTVITINMEDKVQFVERTHDNQNGGLTFINHEFQIEKMA